MSEKDKKNGLVPPWMEAGTVTALLVPLCYTAGWSYAYHYFRRFNLGLMGLDIPREYFFVYSFHAIRDRIWVFLLVLSAFAALMVFGRALAELLVRKIRDESAARMIRFIPAFVLPVAVFCLFAVFYHMGETAAANVFDRQARNDFDGYLRVRIWARPPEKADLRDKMAREWQKGCYRLLMRNKSQVFLFQAQKSGGKIPTDIIPAGRVELIRVMPVNKSCM